MVHQPNPTQPKTPSHMIRGGNIRITLSPHHTKQAKVARWAHISAVRKGMTYACYYAQPSLNLTNPTQTQPKTQLKQVEEGNKASHMCALNK